MIEEEDILPNQQLNVSDSDERDPPVNFNQNSDYEEQPSNPFEQNPYERSESINVTPDKLRPSQDILSGDDEYEEIGTPSPLK